MSFRSARSLFQTLWPCRFQPPLGTLTKFSHAVHTHQNIQRHYCFSESFHHPLCNLGCLDPAISLSGGCCNSTTLVVSVMPSPPGKFVVCIFILWPNKLQVSPLLMTSRTLSQANTKTCLFQALFLLCKTPAQSFPKPPLCWVQDGSPNYGSCTETAGVGVSTLANLPTKMMVIQFLFSSVISYSTLF